MIWMYVALVVLCLWGIRLNLRGFNEDCLEKEQCNAIKGGCITLVFISHIAGYIGQSGYAYDSYGDGMFQLARSLLGQLIVVMFLFYSGYGIMESIKAKGRCYIEAMPHKRILTVFINFDIAVCVFLCIDMILGIKVSISQALLSFFAWDSVGNSNWYIFVIIVCYSASYIVFRTIGVGLGKMEYASWLSLVCFVCISLGLSFVKESWWYNTMLAFSGGLLLSQYNERVLEFLKRYYWPMFMAIIMLFAGLYILDIEFRGLKYNALSILFSVLAVLFTMKVKIGNPILCWLGMLVFPIYIYQRIPMIVLHEQLGSPFICNYLHVYIISCLLFTILLAWAYRFVKVSFK